MRISAPSLAFFKVTRSIANEYPFRVLFKSKTSRTTGREQRPPNPQQLPSPFEKQDSIVLHHGGKPIPLDVHPQPPGKLANDAQHPIPPIQAFSLPNEPGYPIPLLPNVFKLTLTADLRVHLPTTGLQLNSISLVLHHDWSGALLPRGLATF